MAQEKEINRAGVAHADASCSHVHLARSWRSGQPQQRQPNLSQLATVIGLPHPAPAPRVATAPGASDLGPQRVPVAETALTESRTAAPAAAAVAASGHHFHRDGANHRGSLPTSSHRYAAPERQRVQLAATPLSATSLTSKTGPDLNRLVLAVEGGACQPKPLKLLIHHFGIGTIRPSA